MNLVVRKLIAKELFVNRWFIIGGGLASIASAVLAGFGRMAFNIGALMWMTSIVALGVMLAIYGVQNERKGQSLQFVLSLPLSPADYVRSKVIGLLLCYFLMWLVATASAIVLVVATDVADGLLPYVILLSLFLLANFSLVLCGALHATTEAAVAASIIVTNMLVSVYMFAIATLPGLADHMFEATPVWNDTVFTILGTELAVLAAALILPFLIAARRRDFL